MLELDVYVTLAALKRELDAHDGDIGKAVGTWAAPAMIAGLKYELELAGGDYHDRAVKGTLPRLLEDVGGDRGEFGSPTIQVRGTWGSVGLGALQDLVQEAFGSVALDRSKVGLDRVEPSYDDCAACQGKSFTFPGGLEDAEQGLLRRPQDRRADRQHRALGRRARVQPRRLAGDRQGGDAHQQAARAGFAPQPPRIVGDTPSRNDPCPCGSGKKYKRCHGA